MDRLDIRDIQLVQFDILKSFAKCCDENGFRYYLCGGTLLGAIRHKGFIPWDDDIDVLMPRPDYEKFISWCKNNRMNEYYEVRSLHLNNALIPYAQILDLRYEVEKKYRYKGSNGDYLWIDIFPMDGVSDDLDELKYTYKRIHFLRKVFAISHAKPFTGKTKIRAIPKTLLIPFANLYGDKHTSLVRDKLAKQYKWDECQYVAGIVMGYGPQERMKKKDWEPYIEVEFEGVLFHAPGCWEYYLRQLFGDYMQLPPVEKRKTHDMVVHKIK